MLKQAPDVLKIGKNSDGHHFNVELPNTELVLLVEQMFIDQEAKSIRKATLLIKPSGNLWMRKISSNIDFLIEKELHDLLLPVSGIILHLLWYTEPRQTIWLVSQ